MKARGKRTVVITAFLVSFIGLRLVCNYLLGQIVGGIFADGTGSRLSYVSSEMEFLPVRGTLYGLSLKDPEDGDRGGVLIERISVRLHLLPLLKRRVELSHLTIDGVTIVAEQDRSAFWSLLEYLFGDTEQPSGWPVSVSDVRVRTRNKAGSLTLAGADYRLEGNNVDFYAKTSSPAPEDPFKTTITADALDVKISELPKVPLLKVLLKGDLGGGKFSFDTATAGAPGAQLNAPFAGAFEPVHVASRVQLKFAAQNFVSEYFGDGAQTLDLLLDVDGERLTLDSPTEMSVGVPPRAKLQAEIGLSRTYPLQARIEGVLDQTRQRLTLSGDLTPTTLQARIEALGEEPKSEGDPDEEESPIENVGQLTAKLGLQNDNLDFEIRKRLEGSDGRSGFDARGGWNFSNGILKFELTDAEKRYAVAARQVDTSFENRTLTFTDTEISAAGESMRLQGSVSTQGWQAGLKGSWDLGRIGEGVPRLEQTSGLLGVDLKLSGPAFDPVLDGTVDISNGSISLLLGTTIVGADHLKLAGRFLNDELLVDSLTADVGGGKLVGKGRWTSVFDADSREGELNLALDKIDFEPISGGYLNLSGELVLRSAAASRLMLEGELRTEHAIYEKTVDIRQILQALSQFISGHSRAVTSDSGMQLGAQQTQAVDYHLRLLSPGGILINTNLAQAELRADLLLLGNTAEPYLEGELQVLNGVFGFQSQEFQLTNAVMNFTGERRSLDPELSILGETQLKTAQGDEHRIFLAITGSLTQPKLNFSSDNGLSENEIVSLLGVSGAAGIQIIGREGASAGYAEVFNPNSDLSLRDRIGGITGLSEVQIVPAFSTTTGEFAPKVIGTRPLIGGLELKLESELTSQQASGAEIEFPLTRNLKVEGGWKTTPVTGNVRSASGAFNVGLRFEHRFPGTGLLPPSGFTKFKVIGEDRDDTDQPDGARE